VQEGEICITGQTSAG